MTDATGAPVSRSVGPPDDIIRTVDLTKVYEGTDFRAVDELILL